MPDNITSPNIPMPALGSWSQACALCGFELEPVLREAGICVDDLGVTPPTVAPESLFKALSLCVQRATRRHFPLVLGECFAFERFNEIDAFISSSPTLRDALEVAGWARELLAPWMGLRLDEFGSEAHLRVELRVPDGNSALMSPVREAVLAVVYQLIRRATRHAPWLMAVRVAYARPAHHLEFESHFGVPVFFNEGADALVMERRWLDAPLEVAALPNARNQARQMIELRLNQTGGGRRIVDDVRWALERRPELLRDGLEATAAALGLHPRTLQRRLQSEGVKYVDIQSDTKLHRAKIMLKRRAMSMELISDELGFSDRRAFTFAFKRWTGVSPSTFRHQQETTKP